MNQKEWRREWDSLRSVSQNSMPSKTCLKTQSLPLFLLYHICHTQKSSVGHRFTVYGYGWYGCGSQQPSESEKRTSARFRTYHRKFRSIHPHSSQSELNYARPSCASIQTEGPQRGSSARAQPNVAVLPGKVGSRTTLSGRKHQSDSFADVCGNGPRLPC